MYILTMVFVGICIFFCALGIILAFVAMFRSKDEFSSFLNLLQSQGGTVGSVIGKTVYPVAYGIGKTFKLIDKNYVPKNEIGTPLGEQRINFLRRKTSV